VARPPPGVTVFANRGLGGVGLLLPIEDDDDDAFTFTAQFTKPLGQRLGIDVLSCRADSSKLVVQNVAKGAAVDTWNINNHREHNLRPGDYIINVNGTGDFSQMMEELRMASELRISVLRRKVSGLTTLEHLQQPVGDTAATAPKAKAGKGKQVVGQGAPPVAIEGGGLAQTLALHNTPAPGEADPRVPSRGLPNTLPEHYKARLGMGEDTKTPPGLAANSRAPLDVADESLGDEPFCFEVYVDKPTGMKLGIEVMLVTGNRVGGLVVDGISPGGCVDAWNRQSQPPYQVQSGDFIVQVNGIGRSHAFSKLAEEFAKDRPSVSFTVQRGPREILEQLRVKQRQVATASPQALGVTQQTGAGGPRRAAQAAAATAAAAAVDLGLVPAPGLATAGVAPWAAAVQAAAAASFAAAKSVQPVPKQGGLAKAMAGVQPPQAPGVAYMPLPVGPVPADPAEHQAKAAVAAEDADVDAPSSVADTTNVEDQLQIAKLFERMLLLDDGDYARLLRAALKERPWLQAPIEKALEQWKTRGSGQRPS